MRLTSLTVQHYKSLSNVGMDNIQPVTVLVGTNAAGKSNVVDVLKFLRDMVSESLEHAISRRNGITAIRQHSRTRPYQISIKLCLLDDEFEDGEARESSYEITISSLVAGNYKVEREAAFWYEDEHDFDEETQDINFIGVAQHSMQRSSDGIVLRNGKETKLVLPPDQVALGLTLFRHSDGIAAKISNFVRSLRFTTIFPNTLREPKKPDADAALKETGENWASILKALKRTPKGRHELERIKEMMQVVMPNLRDVSVTTVGGYLVPQFRVAETSGKKEVTYDLDPSQLSDGTLRVLGILLALYQLPHPSFVAIEEPEQTVHPGLLAMLAEAFHEVSERTQLFVTSHSPHLIEYFAPEEIRVVAMEDGETRVTGIKSAQLEAIKEKLISIQELMLAEGLQVEEA
jgi:predicted ATPase